MMGATDPPNWAKPVYWFVVDPPGWLAPLLYLLIAGLIVAVAYRAHTQGVSEAQREGLVANVWAVACLGGGAWLLAHYAPLSYALDVLLGAGCGAAVWWQTVGWATALVDEWYHDVVADNEGVSQ